MTTDNPSIHPPRYTSSLPRTKRLGGYLVEAGLLTPAQVDVALNDQKSSGMRFGEVLAARGWVKQQTIEYLMQKVILPEQEAFLHYPSTDGTLDGDVDTQASPAPRFDQGTELISARPVTADETLRNV